MGQKNKVKLAAVGTWGHIPNLSWRDEKTWRWRYDHCMAAGLKNLKKIGRAQEQELKLREVQKLSHKLRALISKTPKKFS